MFRTCMNRMLVIAVVALVALPVFAYDLEGFVYAADGSLVDGATVTAHYLASP